MVKQFDYQATNTEHFNPKIYYIVKQETSNPSSLYQGGDFGVLIHLLSGSCTYIIDGKEFPAKPGDIIVINPGSTHQKIPGPGETIVEFNIGFYEFCITGFKKNYLIEENANPITQLVKYRSSFTSCCEEIIREGSNEEKGYELVLKSLAMKLIALFMIEKYNGNLSSGVADLSYKTNDKRSIVRTIVKYMDENYMKDISLETISKNMYLSSVYISKLFKEETGESPINHLIKVRLSKAKEMLEKHPVSIKTAAELVGYYDAYYFSKLFKKYYGYSPSKIMKKHSQEN